MTPFVFTEQIIGFMLQVLPVSLLVYVPFSRSDLVLPPRKLFPAVAALMLFFSIVFAVLSLMIWTPTDAHNTLLRNASNLYTLGCILLWGLVVMFSVRADFTAKFVVMGILIHYAAINFTLTSVFRGYANLGISDEPLVIYSYDNNSINALLLLFLCPLVYLYLKKIVKPSLQYMDNQILKRSCIYTVLALILFCGCLYGLNSLMFYYGFYGAGLITLLLAFILTDAILYYILFSEVRLTRQNMQLEEQLRSFDEQYRQISKNIGEVRRARHDIRHHLNAISTLNARGEYQALSEYLKSYESAYQEIEDIPLCSYPPLDNILRYYLARAADDGIHVSTEMSTLQTDLRFDIIDLTVMMGNLLDNALEACRHLPADSERCIRVWIQNTDACLLIQIENSCITPLVEHPEFSDGTCFSSTKHTALHGQGLKSIRFVAEKYGGSAEFKQSDGAFTARIVLNIP